MSRKAEEKIHKVSSQWMVKSVSRVNLSEIKRCLQIFKTGSPLQCMVTGSHSTLAASASILPGRVSRGRIKSKWRAPPAADRAANRDLC